MESDMDACNTLKALFLLHDALVSYFTAGHKPDWVKNVTCDNDNKDGEMIFELADGTTVIVRSNDFGEEGTEPLFSVVEYVSHFSVRHNPSGKEHPMSDGVDAVFDENGVALSPGSDWFRERWAAMLNEAEAETLEAYFPEFVED